MRESKGSLEVVDTGSDVLVVSETYWRELNIKQKNMPTLPVVGMTIVGIMGIRSK